MPWVRFDDNFTIHRKVQRLSDPAFRLHVSAICWAARNLTDGFVPASSLRAVATGDVRRMWRLTAELEDGGLWEKQEGGWSIHDYLDFNPSKAKVMEDRKKNAARQRDFKARRKARTGNGVSDSVSNSAPTRPLKDKDSLRSSLSTSRKFEMPRRDVDQLCDQLRSRIIANGARASVTQRWKDAARLMLDRDGRDFEQATRLIDWATAHEFWAANILSMPKFRARYDTLLMQAKREQRQQPTGYQSTTDRNIESFLRGAQEHPQLPPGGDQA